MNAHQRKKFAAWKHSRLPLGLPVMVRGRAATVHKHNSRERPNTCIVQYCDQSIEWVPLSQVEPCLRVKVRPWWRISHDKRKGKLPPETPLRPDRWL